MPIDVVMPKLGLNMSEGLLVEWLKKEGDPVKRGESLFTVETDKVTTESVAQVDGVLGKILVEAGATVPVRTVVGLILADGEKFNPDEVAAPAMAQAVIEQKPADAKQIPNNMPSIARSRKILATPLAKRLATENALDLASIQGTGPDGRIGQEDVERAVSKLQAAPTPAIMTPSASQQQILPIDGVRALIAERMTHSMQSSAQLTLHSEIDASG